MQRTIENITVYFPGKLAHREAEVMEFAKELYEENKRCAGIRIWETKRHELAGVRVK